MNEILEEMQKQALRKAHEMKCDIEMQMSIWYPARKHIDYLMKCEGFLISPLKDETSIFSLTSLERPRGIYFPLITIFVLCKKEDIAYAQRGLRKIRKGERR